MSISRVLIQASSISWAGGKDLCMAPVGNGTAIESTMQKTLDSFPDADVIVIAPEFDRHGELNKVIEKISNDRLSVFYGYDSSPLMRMLHVCSDMMEQDYIVRVDGLHFAYDTAVTASMFHYAIANHIDCVKLPDDFPIAFSSEIFRVGALRDLHKRLVPKKDDKYHVHPKHYFFMNSDVFNVCFYNDYPKYSDEYLMECRSLTSKMHEAPRLDVDSAYRIASGDTPAFHYEFASQFMKKNMKVLDIACGEGYGVEILSPHCHEVHGADLDAHAIDVAIQKNKYPNVKYYMEDVTRTSFPDETYDAVTCFETLEHVPERECLAELYRILKPGGVLVLSTPQNSHGHIPLNYCHIREYSIRDVTNLVSEYFIVVRVVGIKAGIIYDDINPYGTNSILVAIKPRY